VGKKGIRVRKEFRKCFVLVKSEDSRTTTGTLMFLDDEVE
jgi:hypothetical protein